MGGEEKLSREALPLLKKLCFVQHLAYKESLGVVKKKPKTRCTAGDVGLIPRSGRSPGEGNHYPLQYSCLGNPTDREAQWVTVHGVTGVRHDLGIKPPPPRCCQQMAYQISTTSIFPQSQLQGTKRIMVFEQRFEKQLERILLSIYADVLKPKMT